jgi:hypothetical protein
MAGHKAGFQQIRPPSFQLPEKTAGIKKVIVETLAPVPHTEPPQYLL